MGEQSRELLIRGWEAAMQGDARQIARTQTFITNDGWFTYNMATNLAQM